MDLVRELESYQIVEGQADVARTSHLYPSILSFHWVLTYIN